MNKAVDMDEAAIAERMMMTLPWEGKDLEQTHNRDLQGPGGGRTSLRRLSSGPTTPRLLLGDPSLGFTGP